MGKLALLFPGQGSQYVGMGRALAETYPEARQVFEEADAVLSEPISSVCFSGPEEKLKDTRNAQPAILTTSIAVFRILTAVGIRPDFVAGHSLGEYSALVAAEALTLGEALKLVQSRARLMANADPEGKGSMAAILGLDRPGVLEIVHEASTVGQVDAANFNCPGQIVISGDKGGLAKAQELVAARGGKFIPLSVSGPFHSGYMKPAADAFRPELAGVRWGEPKYPVIANVTAAPVSRAELPESLYRQIFSPVLWEDSLRVLSQDGVTVFVEVGPGKVLSGLAKKTVKEATLLNCEDPETIKKALAILKEV